MSDLPGFGTMDIHDRGGPHDFTYEDAGATPPQPGLTPSQTVGPFFAYGLVPGPYGYAHRDIHSNDLAGDAVEGERITIEGQVLDGAGTPIPDAMVEIVQADSAGRYVTAPRNDGFTGYGRCGTGADGPDGRFRFRTVRPGATSGAPFVTLVLIMRGLLNHAVTRMYFPEETDDAVLAQVPEERRHTLVAEHIAPGRYRFDIRMQGSKETVFFDL